MAAKYEGRVAAQKRMVAADAAVLESLERQNATYRCAAATTARSRSLHFHCPVTALSLPFHCLITALLLP